MCAGAGRRCGFRSATSISASPTRTTPAIRRRARSSSIRAAISETEILLAYGGVRFASKMGQLAGNHFITITSNLENVAPLGKMALWKGAQDIVFEKA